MLDGGAAAAADQVDAVLGDEALQPARHFGGAQRIMRVAVDQFRQAGIGLHARAGRASSPPASAHARPFPAGRWRNSARSAARRAPGPRSPRRRYPGPPAACRWFPPSPARRSAYPCRPRARASLAPFTAALICSVSWQVSIRIASTPPCDQAAALLGQRRFQRIVGDIAQRWAAWCPARRCPPPSDAARRQNSPPPRAPVRRRPVDLEGAVLPDRIRRA